MSGPPSAAAREAARIERGLVVLTIGVQSFDLAYKPEAEPDHTKKEQLEWMAEQLAHALAAFAAERVAEERKLGRALYDALTEDSVRWIREDGGENKLAVAIANYRESLEGAQ